MEAKVIPWSSIVGTGLMIVESETGHVICQLNLLNIQNIPLDATREEIKQASISLVNRIASLINRENL